LEKKFAGRKLNLNFCSSVPHCSEISIAANILINLNPLDEKPKGSRVQRLHNFLQCLRHCTEHPQ
jgi:hypothetical protein